MKKAFLFLFREAYTCLYICITKTKAYFMATMNLNKEEKYDTIDITLLINDPVNSISVMHWFRVGRGTLDPHWKTTIGYRFPQKYCMDPQESNCFSRQVCMALCEICWWFGKKRSPTLTEFSGPVHVTKRYLRSHFHIISVVDGMWLEMLIYLVCSKI